VNKDTILHLGDCLEKSEQVPSHSVDLILCDPPYGTTVCKWDTVIPYEQLWEMYKRVLKPNGTIILFGVEPFSSALRLSNLEQYKYDWKWKKNNAANFAQAKNMPLKNLEDIMVFGNFGLSQNSKMLTRYKPQGVKEVNWERPPKGWSEHRPTHSNNSYTQTQTGYPTQILDFPLETEKLHPTQKPISLLKYLIKTYTSENDLVFDNCMGSGSTGVAAFSLNRRFVGIEKDIKYFNIAHDRLFDRRTQLEMFR
jgi:DNA modification methylase